MKSDTLLMRLGLSIQRHAYITCEAVVGSGDPASTTPQEIMIGSPLKPETPGAGRKAQIDALLLKLLGASGRKINGLDAYFVSDKMFACISGNGIGLRLPVAIATELQFSRDNVVPFQPGGMASTREWIQINRAEAAEYEKDLELFQASLDFVKTGRASR